MERPGSAETRVAGSTPALAQALNVASAQAALRRSRLAVHVGDPEPASHHEFGQLERGEERSEHFGRLFEGRRLEHLAADVRVDADEFDAGHELECSNGLSGGTGGDRESELRVLLACADELVRMRFDTGCDPNQDLGPVRSRSDGLQQAAEAADLVERVDDDAAHALLYCGRQLVD